MVTWRKEEIGKKDWQLKMKVGVDQLPFLKTVYPFNLPWNDQSVWCTFCVDVDMRWPQKDVANTESKPRRTNQCTSVSKLRISGEQRGKRKKETYYGWYRLRAGSVLREIPCFFIALSNLNQVLAKRFQPESGVISRWGDRSNSRGHYNPIQTLWRSWKTTKISWQFKGRLQADEGRFLLQNPG